MAAFLPRRENRLELPEDLIKAASVDELELPCRPGFKGWTPWRTYGTERRHAVPAKCRPSGSFLDYAENTDCFVLINAKDNRSLGEYYLK